MIDPIATFVCSHIFDATRPILYVCKADGDWQFLCGEGHDESERPHVVGRDHLLELDQTLQSILDLPDDWEAERETVGGEWVRRRC